jgi:hypothetical protein
MSSQGAINADKEQPMSTKCAARTRSQTRGSRLIRRRLLEKKNCLDEGDNGRREYIFDQTLDTLELHSFMDKR